MKKFTLLTMFVLAIPICLNAQITLGTGDFPYPGLTVTYHEANDSTGALNSLISAGTPGAGGIYSVAGASSAVDDTTFVSWVAPANTPFPAQHPDSDLSWMWRSLMMFTDTCAWQWAYFFTNSDGVYFNGMSIVMDTGLFNHLTPGPTQGFTPKVKDTLEIMSSNFALGYTNHDSLFSWIMLTSPWPLVIAEKGVYHMEVDGWGSLTTPVGTYNVLRLKQTRKGALAFIPPADTNTNFTYTDVEYEYVYTYLGKGVGSAVAEIYYTDASFSTVKQVKWCTTPPAGISEQAVAFRSLIYPTATKNLINFYKPDVTCNTYQMEVYNLDGRLMEARTLNFDGGQQLNVSSYSTGMYLVVMNGGGNRYTARFIKMD